jgi:hypothetical protein
VLGLRLGEGGFCGGAFHLGFGAEPIVEVVTVFSTALLIQFVRSLADFLFEVRVRLGRNVPL